MRAMPSATDRTVPTSVRSAEPVSSPSIRSRRMLAISSGLISIFSLPCLLVRRGGHALSKFLQATADARVQDHVADLQDDAAEDPVVDRAREVDLLPGLAFDLLADFGDDLRVQLDGAGDGDVDTTVLLFPKLLEGAADAEDLRHPLLVDEQLEEIDQLGLGTRDRSLQPRHLLLGGEVGAEEEDLQLAVAVDGI